MSASCTAEDFEAYYSLASLSSPTDYKFKSPFNSHEYTINVCQAVTTDLWNINGVPEDKVGGFYRGKSGDFSIGTTNDTVRVVDGNPIIWLTDGSPCPQGKDGLRASTAIRFVCDRTAGTGNPQLIAQFPPEENEGCSFFLEWRTSAACPTGLKGAGVIHSLALFSAILFVAFFVYIIAATLYNRFFLGLRGLDQLPSIPSLRCTRLTNCFGWIHDKITGRGDGFVGGPRLSGWGSRARDGFRRLPEEEGMMVAEGRFSLDDEEEEEGARHGHNGYANGNGNGVHLQNEWATAFTREHDGVGSDGVIRL